ncbi:trypsin-like serine protease [Candidatus Pacearchaeota archaeon]|nr:trypsin-like serine protease [Candidatus Pacearchaeota archaeon]
MDRHHGILYGAVVILLVLHIASFLSISAQITQTNAALTRETSSLNESFISLLRDSLQEERTTTQQTFSALRDVIGEQQAFQDTLQEDLELLKSSTGDFSEVISEVIKGVVSIGTDTSMGTGFVLTDSGYIVTNQHVIAGAKRIEVLTHDRKVIVATLIGADVTRDVALLKVNAVFESLELADDLPVVGNKVIAIGNPLGLAFTVTEGIVSALNRKGPNGQQEYIQTDVSLNPGNSGGPLINVQGEVVGMNNFKVGNAESLGFALEGDVVKRVVNTLANATILS